MITYTGRTIDVVNLEQNEYVIEDIAHALSHICRYNGHCKTFYSVAQHCVLCSEYASKEHKLAALLHDAAEAYLGDIIRPLKKLLPDHRAIEVNFEKHLFARLGVQYPFDQEVIRIDDEMLRAELRDLMSQHEVQSNVPPVFPWSSGFAKHLFVKTYKQLCKTTDP